MHRPERTGRPPVIDFTEVKVEIDAFDDFMKLMQGGDRAESPALLRPDHHRPLRRQRRARSPRTAPSIPLYEFQHAVQRHVDSAVAGLRSYVEATKVLVRARRADGRAVPQAHDGMAHGRAMRRAGRASSAAHQGGRGRDAGRP